MEIDRSALPFMVLHGALIWKLMLVVAVVAVTALVRLIARARGIRLRPIVLVIVAGATFGIVLKIEYALGSRWEERCHYVPWRAIDKHDDDPVTAPVDVGVCVRAAAMPGSRDAALSRMLDALANDTFRDGASVRMRYALSDLVEGCTGLGPRLLADGRYDEAAATAHDCGDARTEHLALRSAGKLDEAIAVAVPEHRDADGALPAYPDVDEWILTGHWAEAAAAADARIVLLRGHKAKDATVAHYRCLAELLKSYAGAPNQLRELGATGCSMMLAELATGDARRALLETQDGVRAADQLRDMIAMSEGIATTTASEYSPAEVILADPTVLRSSFDQPAQIWLHASAPPTTAPTRDQLRWTTVAHVIAGDLDAAARTAASAASLPTGQVLPTDRAAILEMRARERARFAPLLPALVALRTPSTAIGVPQLDETAGWEKSFPPLFLRVGQRDKLGDALVDHALLAASDGDGSDLAPMIALPQLAHWTDGELMAVLPRLVADRDTVVRQLAWAGPADSPYVHAGFPFDDALRAAARRDLLRVAGLAEPAARWAAIEQRFDHLLRDRRRLIALLLWQLEVP